MCRSLRMNNTKESSWDFVVSDKDKATAVNVTKNGDGFSVRRGWARVNICLMKIHAPFPTSQINVEGREIFLPEWDMSKSTVSLEVEGEPFILQIHGRGNGPQWKIGFQGASYDFRLLSPYAQTLLDIMPQPKLSDTAKELLSPMPGVVRSIMVKVGDKVFKGQEVCTIGESSHNLRVQDAYNPNIHISVHRGHEDAEQACNRSRRHRWRSQHQRGRQCCRRRRTNCSEMTNLL